MREVPVSAASSIPDHEQSWFKGQLGSQRTLGDVFDWMRRQSPARTVTEILTQDEYTHDVVVEWNPHRFLVFDAT